MVIRSELILSSMFRGNHDGSLINPARRVSVEINVYNSHQISLWKSSVMALSSVTFPMHGLGTLKFYVTDKTFQKH